MGPDRDELRGTLLEALQHRIRPQDEVVATRRLMAFHVAQSLGAEQLSSPLSLVDEDVTVSHSEKLDEDRKAYLDAVERNAKARQEFAQVRGQLQQIVAAPPPKKDAGAEILDLHLSITALEQKRRQLLAIDTFLDQLDEQPAAAPNFLDPEIMFKDCSPLPEVPKELVDGFAVNEAAADDGTSKSLQTLQRALLRKKLMTQREKSRWEELQARDPVDISTLSPEAKLAALNSVKQTLISWIETHLSKAGDGEVEPDSEHSSQTPRVSEGQSDYGTKLEEIQKEYDRHVELRKEIIALMAQKDKLGLSKPAPPEPQPEQPRAETRRPAPEAHNLIPFVEQLHRISSEQKGLIEEKSHIQAALSKQQQDTVTALDRLADESQLLAKYPAAKSPEHEPGFDAMAKSNGKIDVSDHIEPWTLAAESAKIANLESVFEKVEQGQTAIDEAMTAIGELEDVLNVDRSKQDPQTAKDDENDDLWLSQDQDRKGAPVLRKRVERKQGKDEPKSIWSKLDGNLGLINQ